MNLPIDYLTRPHVVFDVESFGLHGSSFAVAAVLLKPHWVEAMPNMGIVEGHQSWRELAHFAATDKGTTPPWTLDQGEHSVSIVMKPRKIMFLGRETESVSFRPVDGVSVFNWLQANIPDSVFDPKRLTGDLSIFQLFDAFVEAVGEDVMLWAEVPVPVEANFLNELRGRLQGTPRGDYWKSMKAPLLRDIASLADPLGISDERVDMHKPAHDPLNDARASARRLSMALSKIARLREP